MNKSSRPARALTDGETILAAVNVAATPERVFRALTTSEVERWWGSPDTYRVTDWAADVRVGGRATPYATQKVTFSLPAASFLR